MRLWKCDRCGKEDISKEYPKDWIFVRVYKQPQIKGGNSKQNHICNICKKDILKKLTGEKEK